MLFYNIRSRSLLVQYKVKVKIWFRNIHVPKYEKRLEYQSRRNDNWTEFSIHKYSYNLQNEKYTCTDILHRVLRSCCGCGHILAYINIHTICKMEKKHTIFYTGFYAFCSGLSINRLTRQLILYSKSVIDQLWLIWLNFCLYLHSRIFL